MKKGLSKFSTIKGRSIFLLCFFSVLFIPLYGGFIDRFFQLDGVVKSREVVSLNYHTLASGEYQTYLNSKWEDNFPGRVFLLKARNQILYSALGESPNQNVIIGKHKYLYGSDYILYEIQAVPPETEEYFENLGSSLATLSELLAQSGKELYVFITPSKARYFRENIPSTYMILQADYGKTNYEKLCECLKENGINYFDSNEVIKEAQEHNEFKAPLFHATGIHWNKVWGEYSAACFLEYMNSISKYDLGAVNVSETKSLKPIDPDADLYSSLNLLVPPKGDWYAAKMDVVKAGSDHPNVFFRGGSFMGQSLSALISCGIFGENTHFENYYYFRNNYKDYQELSGFTAYEELNLDQYVGEADIVVLEVNEAAIAHMSWGFIDYLLAHPEYTDAVWNIASESQEEWGNAKIRFEGVRDTDLNPWGVTAGLICEDNQKYALLNPFSAMSIEFDQETQETIRARIYPEVAEFSDGAVLRVVIRDENEKVLSEYECKLSNESEWTTVFSDMIETDNRVTVDITCLNEEGGSDSCDWVIVECIKSN